jgi:SAM-dependent methyltransferase
MKQQDQTKNFFKGHASEWQIKASDEVYHTINDRHRAAHRTLSQYDKGSTLLDVGCGTGQLAIESAENGYESLGIDFAGEMIDQCKINATDSQSSAEFQVASVFDYSPKKKFDVISGMGFIEYISLDQLDDFLDFCFVNTTDNGAVSIGSRNRLFNVTTFNDYTEMEKKLGSLEELIDESSICIRSTNTNEYLESLRGYVGSNSLIQNDTHPLTAIGVETRFQFTPSDLMQRIESHGFKVTNIYPVNYHAFLPIIDDNEIKTLRKKISDLISIEGQSDFRYIPNSSSFVIEAKK